MTPSRFCGFLALMAAFAILVAAVRPMPANAQCADIIDFSPDDLNKPMKFFRANSATCVGGNAVSWPTLAVGVITEDTIKDFKAYFELQGGLIEFNSPGGDLDAAMKLGELIRQQHIGTSLGTVCASACAYAFIGGERRYAVKQSNEDYLLKYREMGATGDKFGVHQFYDKTTLDAPTAPTFSPNDRSADQNSIAKIIDYVIRMGIDPKFVIIASQVKPWEPMRWLSRDERIALRVDNMIKTYTPVSVKPFGRNGLYAEITSVVSSDKSSIRLFCKREKPGVYATFVINDKDANQYAEMIGQMEGRAEFDSHPSSEFSVQVTDKAEKDENGEHNVYVEIYIDKLNKNNMADLKYISISDPDFRLSRARQWINDLTRFRVVGDRRLVSITMRNCING